MSRELREALDILEKEKSISKDTCLLYTSYRIMYQIQKKRTKESRRRRSCIKKGEVNV